MRIIAKNHDYYDCGMATGQDKAIIYRRFEETFRGNWKVPIEPEFDFMRTGLRNRRPTNKKGVDFEIESFTVAFCGKRYPGIKVVKNPLALKPDTQFFYDNGSYLQHLKKNRIVFKKPEFGRQNWHLQDLAYEVSSEEYFKRTGDDSQFEFFVEKRIPVAAWYRDPEDIDEDLRRNSNYILKTNGQLKDFNFQKVFDPWTAFQEVSMFVGGCMVGDEAAMARVDDEHMMRKKGFDHPYSFRKEPTKKR